MTLTPHQNLARAALNEFIIAHLAGAARPLRMEELHGDVYPGKPASTASLVALRKRLTYLALDGRVLCYRRGNARLWTAPSQAQRQAQAQADLAAAQAMPVAAPRRINIMAGTYTPPRGPVLRAGADHAHIASRGYRC